MHTRTRISVYTTTILDMSKYTCASEKQQKKMQWAQVQRADHVMKKLDQDSDRMAAFKEVQRQQRLAIFAIQKQVLA